MKKIYALLLSILMVLSLTACGYGDVAEPLVFDFKENADKTPQEIADALLQNPVIEFMPATMPVEEGVLTGFGDAEIKGFDKGVMFGPAIGTIPFIGYVFDLSDDTDAKEFENTLKENADLNWNICTEADELVVESDGDKVIVIMTPEKFEDTENNAEDIDAAQGEDKMVVIGDDFVDDFE